MSTSKTVRTRSRNPVTAPPAKPQSGHPRERVIRNPQSEAGLYNPAYEHDSCGVGFLVHLKGQRSHQLIRDAILALNNLSHRGACGCEVNTGDGAGVLIQVPDEFLRQVGAPLGIELPERG